MKKGILQFLSNTLRTRKFIAVLVTVLLGSALNAQVSTYTFGSSAGTYTPITGGTVLGTPTNDDNIFAVNPIGFNFCYNGAIYTQFGVCANGWIYMGNATAFSSYTSLSSGTQNNVIAAFNLDIQGEPTTGDLQYSTIGTSPNRTLVVQWTNYDRFSSTTNTDNYNFQIRLSESNGQVQVVYGSWTANSFQLAQVGLRGNSNVDFSNRVVSNGVQTWATSIAGVTNADVCESNVGLTPVSGQTFTWSQPTAPALAINASFTAVTSTGMTVNWVDNSTNEANFFVQRSTDNITFTTVSTIPSGSVATTGTPYNYVATGLYNGTLYYWRILAGNANCGGGFLAGQQATLPGTLCGTFTVGPTGAYTSLTAAFAAVATNGVSCPLVFDLQAAYVSTVETFPLNIPFLGNGPTNTITVRPELGATNLSITSGATQTLNFNGAQYITFDGRPGSLGTVRHLTIENTSTTGNAAQFINDGAYNGFNYCTVRGVNTTAASGVVLFSSALTGGIGNSFNTISNCELRDGASQPANLVYGANFTANVFNTGNTFTNNIFHDWFSATAVNSAITASTGNTAWNISNNSFYQTATRTFTVANTNTIVNMTSGSGSATGAYVVTGNFFGGSAALCGGTAYTTAGAVGHRFIALQMNTGTGGVNSIQGNTFRNFNVSTTASTTTSNGIWCAINTIGTNGANNIGTITPNVIGSTTANAQIITSSTLSGGLLVGINNSASGVQNISNNQIGGLTANTSAITVSSSIVGIQTTSGASTTISGNTIGSLTQSSSLINAASNSGTGGQVTGILCSAFNSSLPGNQITNNMVMNLTNQYAGIATTNGFVRGIVSTSGINTITGNTVSILSNLAPQTGTTTTSSVIGISQQSASSGANQTVAQNTISNLVNLSFSGNVQVVGINATGTTLNQTLVYRNNIIGIGSASAGSAVMHGIQIYGGTCRVYNNFVNIGVDATGASLTLSHEFNGINKNTANRATVIFNTVNVGGTGIGAGTANTNAFRRILNPTVTPSDSVYSNIFTNVRSNGASTGTHYSININNNTNFLANANVYYGNGTGYQTGAVGATNYASISLWLGGVPGQDLSSFQVDPTFLSATNLHINNASQSVLESRAIAVGNVNTDIDNQVRPGPTAVNGGGTAHDIGADEFDGIPVNVDLGIQLLVLPTTTGCHTNCEIVRVRLRNYTGSALNMATNNVTITSSTTGPNPQTFAPLVISSGTLSANGFLDTAVAICYDMSAVGTHVFNASSSTALDFITSNNGMTPVPILISGGTATSNRPSMCYGDSALITLTGATNGGTIQWQSSPDNLIWTNIVGATTSPLNTGALTDTMFYRAMVCGTYPSVSDTAAVPFIAPAVTVNDTICGFGAVNLTASGSGTLTWFATPTGGTVLATGPAYSPAVTATTTFYVQNSSGTPPTTQVTTYAAGNGFAGNMFAISAVNTITISSFDGHMTSGTATWEIWYRPNDYYLSIPASLSNVATNGWTLLGSAPNVVAAGLGVPTPLPIPVNITIPAGQTYSFYVTTTGPTVNYTNGTAVNTTFAPASNTDFTFKQGYGGGYNACTIQPRIWNGTIHYSSGCGAARTSVIAVVDPAPVVNVSSSNNVCGSGTANLTATSVNTNYGYTWTPGATLSTTTGPATVATPTTTTTYLVTGLDTATGCVDTASVRVLWALPPQVAASVAPDTICSGSTANLNGSPTFTNPVIVGTATATPNTTTTYPAPYGNFYWGSRHQMLITAVDLTAAGLTPGFISALSFELTNTSTLSTLVNYEIKLGSTTASSLTAFYTGSMTSVFTAPTFTPTTGVNTHTFTTPYFWDGVSDLIVETCHNNTSFIDNSSFRQTLTSYSSTVYYRADAAGVCGNNAVTATASQRPIMRLWRSSASWDYAWTPAGSLSNANIANPIATPTVTTDYILTVTDSVSGCVSLDTATVVVNPSPAPSFGPDTVICSNATLLLDGTAGPYTYMWQDSTMNQTYTANLFGTYSVLVTDSVTGCAGTDTILVGINAAPSFTLGADAVICAGTQVSFNGPIGAYSYMWSTADTVATITTGTAGSYDLAVTDIVNGCSSSDTIALTVNPVPAVALGSDTALCNSAGSITLSGPSGNYTYLWSTTDSTQAITVNSSATYIVTVTDTATSCASADSIVVTYNANPTVALGSDSTQCGGSITVTAPAGSFTYLWSDNSTNSSLSASTSGLYYVLVTDSATGCAGSDSINLAINTVPVITLGPDSAYCGPVTLDAGLTANGDYLWSDNSTSQTLLSTTSGTYFVTVTDSVTGCSAVDSVSLTINAAPAVALGPDSTLCGGSVLLDAGATANGGYVWSDNSTNQTLVANASGTYYVTVTDTLTGCSGSDSVDVVVNTLPTVTFNIVQTTICTLDAAISLTGSPAGGTFSGPGVTGSTFAPATAGVGTHTITYTFTDANGCQGIATDVITVSPCVGINDPFVGAGMNVYPNPNSGTFMFTAANQSCNEMTIEVMTVDGQVVKSNKHSNVQGNFTEEINMNEFANGVYFMRVITDGAVFTQRIVKQD